MTAERGVRSRENTRARLVEAAAQVFADKGLDGATLDDLTAAAGFTRGAFYSNFESKHELFFAVHDDLSSRLIAVIRETLAEQPMFREAFRQRLLARSAPEK